MSDPDRDAALKSLAESLLNQLQRIGFVNEFTKKPCEHNPDYLDEFESAIVELYEKFTVIVKSAKKRVKDSSQNSQEVSDTNQNQEENNNCNSYTADNVQIRVSSEEMRRRIKAFKLGRRRLKDERNVQEYCGRPYIEELHPLWGEINTCARVDAVFIPRYDGKSRVKVSRVRNVWGPQTRAVVEEAKQTDNENDKLERITTDYIAIEERLLNMEVHLKLKDSSVKKNVFQRIKELEDRILFLEGTTPELLISPSTSNESPPPKKQNADKNAVKREAETDKYDNWSIDDVQRRIDILTESLKSKYPAAKNL